MGDTRRGGLPLADEASYEVFITVIEQALVLLADGRIALVTGDVGSITFAVDGEGRVTVDVGLEMVGAKE